MYGYYQRLYNKKFSSITAWELENKSVNMWKTLKTNIKTKEPTDHVDSFILKMASDNDETSKDNSSPDEGEYD